jgi:ABC-type multidrug transport system permease subunit
MTTTQKISLAAGLVVFLAIGITATVTGGSTPTRTWGWAAIAGLLAYALTAFGIGIAQGAAQAKRDRRRPNNK